MESYLRKHIPGLPWWSSGYDRAPNAEGSDSTPGQRSRSFLHDATKSSNAATKGSTGRNRDPAQPNKLNK